MYETKRCVVIVVLMVRMEVRHGDVFFPLHNLIIFYVYV